MNEQRRAISVKSAERVYDQALYKRTGSRTFTPAEVAGIGEASTKLLIEELDKLAEWEIVTVGDPEKAVIQKKPKKEDTD